jgi:hypothetical protein
MPQNSYPTPLEIATSWPVVRRALGYAVIVGALLIAINHGDAIVRGDLDPVRLFKMGLTVLVPYMVSTLSSVQAMRASAQTERGSIADP